MKISILLPYKENFSPTYAGAVSLFVKDTVKLSEYKKYITVFGNTNLKNIFKLTYKNIELKRNIIQSGSKLYVKEFLKFEKDYLYGEWNLSKKLLTLTIPFSFLALGLAFWKRNLVMGIGVVVLIATGKMVWSIQNAGESGKSILIPAILGLLICCVLIYYGFKKLEKK